MLDEVTSRRSMLRGLTLVLVSGAAGYVVARRSTLAKPRASTTRANGYGPALRQAGTSPP